MPTVPTDQNRVTGNNLPSVRSTVNFTPEAFGAGIGRATQQVGGVIADFAQEQQQKQDMAVLMGAERELQDWENKSLFNPETGAYAQRGRNSFGLTDKLLPEYDKVYGGIESRLTARQKEIFQQRTGNKRADLERGLMRHVGQEAQAFQKAETNALVTTQLETAMLYATDPARFDTELRNAQSTFMAGNSDLPPAALAVGVKEIESRGRAQVVGKLVQADPIAAQRYFDQYRDAFTAADAAQLERVLRPAWVEAEGRRVLGEVKAGGAPVGNWVAQTDTAASIKEAADELGIDAVDLATVISYETGGTFSPDQKGPTTKWGQHKGLIQFGEPQRAKYGVRDGQTVREQMKAVIAYLKDAGVKPGMGILDVYSAINAGGVGRYDASDEKAGGAPGTVRDKVNTQMRDHRKKAEGMFAPGAAVASSPETAAAMIPRTKADVLAALNNIPNPEIRSAALQEYKREIAIEDLRKQETETEMVESINAKVEAADPSTPLRQVLSPTEYAWAAENGKVAGWEGRLEQRLSGLEKRTDPNLLLSYREVVSRAASGDPVAQAELKKYQPYDPALKLSQSDRDWLAKAKADIFSPDPAKRAKAATEGEMSSVITRYTASNLGLPANKKDWDDAQTSAAWDFENKMRTWSDQFQAANGRAPTYSEVTKQADAMTLDGLKFEIEVPKLGGLWTSEQEQTIADLGIPPDTKLKIIDLLRTNGMPVTGPNVAQVYRNMTKGQNGR